MVKTDAALMSLLARSIKTLAFLCDFCYNIVIDRKTEC